jgi:hypothetical protein
VLHLVLYEVPLCDFHHIDGNLLLVPWSYWIDSRGFIFMEPLIFLESYHLMEVFGWGSLTYPWLDGACSLVVSHMCLPCWSPLGCTFDGCGAYYLVMVVWYTCLSWIWMMVVAP